MSSITALILAGGKGTRLSQLHPFTPKPLIKIAGQPFLHWLVVFLMRQGIKDFVFSTGYCGEQIQEWLEHTTLLKDMSWQVKHEREPLGTGGAVRYCADFCKDILLIVNGDSLAIASLTFPSLLSGTPKLDGVIWAKPVDDASRYGSIDFDSHGYGTAYVEKKAGAGVISAGLILLDKQLLLPFPVLSPLSMEHDVMPELFQKQARIFIHVLPFSTPFIDIGTPETLAQAPDFIRKYIMPLESELK